MNLSALFPSSGGRFVTNPKHLPIAAPSGVYVKTASGTLSDNTLAAFFTALATLGAQSAITVADTYVTVANLKGSGFMFNAIAPMHSAAYVPTIRITVDGVPYTIAPTGNLNTGLRLVVGSLTAGTPIITAASGDNQLANGYNDSGFSGGRTSGVLTPASAGIPSEAQILALGLAALRFETSLLVEMKCNLLSATAVHKQCAVTYRMDL